MYSIAIRVIPVLFIILSCSAPDPTDRPAQTVSNPKRTDLVDCNYYWPARKRHVCIKDMPASECEDLFFMTGFQREEQCFCDSSGKGMNRVQGSGYIQYDCE